MRGELFSAVSESFMLSVEIEFEPLELVEDAIVIKSWCEGESICDLRFAIFDRGDIARVSKIVEFDKNSAVSNLKFTKLLRWT